MLVSPHYLQSTGQLETIEADLRRGNCLERDDCYGVCPDNAIIKLGPGKRLRFNCDS